ncbi:uncharacterized protein J4E78_009702 [Alternaria triticimaculans]|uniref:uncharacterized protein n=1 Tax=Alternaria triticimaculans TaxID=297637 RepID=UPI0020C5396A|nr:uncharacterized protein J4E78_009702 [Alternaria triticimaculans]KAI4644118.1 hypothetical protein J4E78_009702 [Alternaria triticimaculans]
MTKVKFTLPPAADKVTSLFHTKQIKEDDPPVFNQPLNTSSCPHHRIARLLYSISLSLLLIIAVPVIALKALTYSFVEDNRMTGFEFQTTRRNGDPGEAIIMAALPRMLYAVPAKLAIIAGTVSICLAAAHLGFVFTDWKKGNRTQSYAFRRNIMFLHITNAILVLFALVSIYVTHKNTSHFREGFVNFRASRMNDTASTTAQPSPSFFRYNFGTFDLETWACELAGVEGAGMVREDYGMQCGIEIAGRAVMIPFVVVAWGVAAIGLWGFVGGGRRGPDGERMKTDEVGLEMGKMNATDD